MSEIPQNSYMGGNGDFIKPEKYNNMQNENYQTASFIKNESNEGSQQTDKYETLEEILARTGYSFDKTPGQHKYGGPPPNYTGEEPGSGHEIYVGKIPLEMKEEELIPIFEKCGLLYEMRLMMNPQTNKNKGFCFITYINKDHAKLAADMYNNYEIRPRKHLKVSLHKPNTRLYVANIPKTKDKDMILAEASKSLEGVREVIAYNIPDDPKKKNRGFAFLDFKSHKLASEAKKKLNSNQVRFFNMDVIADWADPQDEPNDEVMSKVKVLYIRNLKQSVTELDLLTLFSQYGKLEKVKRVKDYGFVHYEVREDALKALESQHNQTIKDSTMTITLAKPPIDPKLKEQRKMQHAILLNRNRAARGGYNNNHNNNNWDAQGADYQQQSNQYNRNYNNDYSNSYNNNEYYDNSNYDYYDQSGSYTASGYENYDQSGEYSQEYDQQQQQPQQQQQEEYYYEDYGNEGQEGYQQGYQQNYPPRGNFNKAPNQMRGRGMAAQGMRGRGAARGMDRGGAKRGGMNMAGGMNRGMMRGGMPRGGRGFNPQQRGGRGVFRGAPNAFRGRGGNMSRGNNNTNLKRKAPDGEFVGGKQPRMSLPPQHLPPPPQQPQQPRFQQPHNAGDAWQPQPIAQKPLNQMPNYQEQWF